MFWTIVVILLVLWALGFATDVMADFIHILLLIALAMIAIRLIRGGTSAI